MNHNLRGMGALVEPPPSSAPKKGGSWLGILAALFLLAAVGYVALAPNFIKGSGPQRSKACYANLRLLQGAVELFNMANPTGPAKELDQRLFQKLMDGGYLRDKAIPTCPGGDPPKPTLSQRFHLTPYSPGFLPPGTYAILGDLARSGRVICTLHGPPE